MARRPVHILLVAAHPADSFDQAGGTLAHHVARGDRVTVLIATTGGNEPAEANMGRRSEMTGGLLPLPPSTAFTSQYRVSKEKCEE